jgi:hypothetical protein
VAETGAGDAHEHPTWTGFRLRDLDELGWLLPGSEPNGLHTGIVAGELNSYQFCAIVAAVMSPFLKLVLRVERAIGAPVETAVHSDAYFDVVAELNRGTRRLTGALESVSKRGLHLLNLPAGTDIRRVREQLARMDRQLLQISKELEQLERRRDMEGV